MAMIQKDMKCGFIDRSGQIVVEPQYEMIFSFKGDLAEAWFDGEKIAYLDKTGKCVWKEE